MLVQTQPKAITGPTAFIPLHPMGFAIVDIRDYHWLSRFRWKIKRSKYCDYAVRVIRREGKQYELKMHREIVHPAAGMQVHHKNRNSLDNRRCNLEEIHPHDHTQIHIYKEKTSQND